MSYYFTTRRLSYKSYQAKMFTISLSSNGTDPQDVMVKVFSGKKPKAEIIPYVGSFSESRGVGFSNGKSITVTDPETVELCRACLVNDGAIAGLIDKILETVTEGRPVTLLARWWVLAQQQNPSQFIEEERRQRAFDDKKFSVGDKVVYVPEHEYRPQEVTITGEQFDWRPYLGGGWRYTFLGLESLGSNQADQSRFREVKETVAVS